MTKVEKLKSEKISLEAGYHSLVPPHVAQQDLMVVCDVCGSFLRASDSEDRFVVHIKSKTHSSIVAIREKIKHL